MLADIYDSTIKVSGGASLSLSTVTSADWASFEVSGGGSLTLAGLISYQEALSQYSSTFEATGSGSELSLPNLTSVAVTNNSTTFVEALSGGDVELPSVTQATGLVYLETNSIASTLDLPLLTTFSGGTLEYSGGDLEIPVLADIYDSTIKVSGGASLSLSTVTSADWASFEVSGGGSLTLAGLISYQEALSQYSSTFEATGSGSELSLPNLTSVAVTNNSTTFVEALSGGDVELPLVTQIIGSVSLESKGSGSVLDLSALESLANGGSQSLTITQGGTVLDPNLTMFANITITTDSTGTFAVPANQTFSFTGGTNTVQTGTLLVQGTLNVQNNATLNIKGSLTINGEGGPFDFLEFGPRCQRQPPGQYDQRRGIQSPGHRRAG